MAAWRGILGGSRCRANLAIKYYSRVLIDASSGRAEATRRPERGNFDRHPSRCDTELGDFLGDSDRDA